MTCLANSTWCSAPLMYAYMCRHSADAVARQTLNQAHDQHAELALHLWLPHHMSTPLGFRGFFWPVLPLARGCCSGEKASLALRCLLAFGCFPGDLGDLGDVGVGVLGSCGCWCLDAVLGVPGCAFFLAGADSWAGVAFC